MASPFGSSLDDLVTQSGAGGDVAREAAANPPLPGETPGDTQDRTRKESFAFARTQAVKARDLASNGMASFSDNGVTTPVQDEYGQPITNYDRKNSVGYDSQGNARKVDIGADGRPQLNDPFAGIPISLDRKTGDQYQIAPGLPWRHVGTDDAVKARVELDAQDRQLKQQRTVLGQIQAPEKNAVVELTQQAKAQQKALEGMGHVFDPTATPDDAHKAIDAATDQEYADKKANETIWFSGGQLTPEAEALRSDIGQRKAQAHALVDGLAQTAGQLVEHRQRMQQIAAAKNEASAQLLTNQIARMKADGQDTSALEALLPQAKAEDAPPAEAAPTEKTAPNAAVTTNGPAPQGALATFAKELGTNILPAAGTAAGAIGAGLLATPESAGLATIPAAIAGGAAGGGLVRKLQDEIFGKQDPEQEAANRKAHPWAAQAGSFLPFLLSMFGGGAITKAGQAAAKAGTALTGGERIAEGMAHAATGGARAGLSEGVQQRYVEGNEEVNPLDEMAKTAVSMGAMGFFAPAKTILQAATGKAVKDTAAVVLASNIYDYVVHGKPIDYEKIKHEAPGDFTAFSIQNAIMHALGGMAKPGKPNAGGEEAPPAAGPETPTEAPDAKPNEGAPVSETRVEPTEPATIQPSAETPSSENAFTPAESEPPTKSEPGTTNFGDVLDQAAPLSTQSPASVETPPAGTPEPQAAQEGAMAPKAPVEAAGTDSVAPETAVETKPDAPVTTATESTTAVETKPETKKLDIQGIVPAIRVGGEVVKGQSGDTHKAILDRHLAAHPEDADAIANFDTAENQNFFVTADGKELTRRELKQQFGVSDSQGLRDSQKPIQSDALHEQKAAELSVAKASNAKQNRERLVKSVKDKSESDAKPGDEYNAVYSVIQDIQGEVDLPEGWSVKSIDGSGKSHSVYYTFENPEGEDVFARIADHGRPQSASGKREPDISIVTEPTGDKGGHWKFKSRPSDWARAMERLESKIREIHEPAAKPSAPEPPAKSEPQTETQVRGAQAKPSAGADPHAKSVEKQISNATEKVAEHIQDVASTDGATDAKSVKAKLIERLEKAVADAESKESPEAKEIRKQIAEAIEQKRPKGRMDTLYANLSNEIRTKDKITIDIPEDGKFTIANNAEALREILARAKRLGTSSEPVEPKRTPLKTEPPKPEERVEAPAEKPGGLAPLDAGAKVRVGSSPQLHTIDEVLPPAKGDQPGEQFFKITNDRTGESQTVEAKDIQPVQERSAEEKQAAREAKASHDKKIDERLRAAGLNPSKLTAEEKREWVKRDNAEGIGGPPTNTPESKDEPDSHQTTGAIRPENEQRADSLGQAEKRAEVDSTKAPDAGGDRANSVAGDSAAEDHAGQIEGHVREEFGAQGEVARALGATIEKAAPGSDDHRKLQNAAGWIRYYPNQRRIVFAPDLAAAGADRGFVRRSVEEELVHAAQFEALRGDYQRDRVGSQTLETYGRQRYRAITRELAGSRIGRAALVHTARLYQSGLGSETHITDSPADLARIIADGDSSTAIELVRQIVQLRKSAPEADITESSFQRGASKLIAWVSRAVNFLKRLARQPDVAKSEAFANAIKSTEAALRGEGISRIEAEDAGEGIGGPKSFPSDDPGHHSTGQPREDDGSFAEGKPESVVARGLKAFDKVKQAMTPGLDAVGGAKKGVQSLLLPSAQSPEHLAAAVDVGKHLGEMHRRQEADSFAQRKDRNAFTRMGVTNEKVPLAENPGIKLMSDISQGRELNGPLAEFASKIKGMFDSRLNLLREADAPVEKVRENYFPGIWEEKSRKAFSGAMEELTKEGAIPKDFDANNVPPDLAATIKARTDKIYGEGKGSDADAYSYFSKQPLKGKESFRKSKVFDDIMTPVSLGLRPVSNNPVDIVNMKLAEMDRSIMANRLFQEWKANGKLKTIDPYESVPEGWEKINDKYGTQYGPPTVEIPEWVDKEVFNGLVDAAKKVGVSHERLMKFPKGPGQRALGLSLTGQNKILSRFGTETSVVAHELGHQLDEKYDLWNSLLRTEPKSGETGKGFRAGRSELRDIADLTGRGPEARSKEEKIAQVLEAYIHAPEKMQEVAPRVFEWFDKFVKSKPELAGLADIKPGLKLQKLMSEKYVGLPIIGYRIVPKPNADILNNYLSSSLYNNRYFGGLYKAWMSVANMLNQAQLGVGSAFHAGFTAMEAQISAGANVIKDIFGTLRGNRSLADLGNTLKEFPTAIYRTFKDGDAVLNAWRNPDGQMDQRMKDVARAWELSGGGFTMEQGLKTDQATKAYEDWHGGHPIRAAMRSPFAAVEMMAKPIMEYLVPRQKAGVFAHLANRIIEQNPNKTMEELAPEFRSAAMRVDARLGQVRYDRLFINNTAKNVIQGLVRAPGWTGGTIAELGGSFKDVGTFLKQWKDTGKLPADVPDRVAYALSLILTTAVANGVLTYAMSGRKPEGDDYLAFRTGRKDEKGNPERYTLPTYMKDVWAYAHEPGQTLKNKAHPLLGVFGDLWANKDYYGVQIADEDASMAKRAMQRGAYIAKAFEPFWIRGQQKARERGAGIGEQVAPLVGVMPAPAAMNQSSAARLASEINRAKIGTAPVTEQQAERRIEKSTVINRMRQGDASALPKAIQQGKILPGDAAKIRSTAALQPIAASVKGMTLEEAQRVFSRATPEEKRVLAPIIAQKLVKQNGARVPLFSGF